MKKVPLSEIKDDLSKYLRLAASEEIIITATASLPGSWSASNPKTIGSTTAWNTTRHF